MTCEQRPEKVQVEQCFLRKSSALGLSDCKKHPRLVLDPLLYHIDIYSFVGVCDSSLSVVFEKLGYKFKLVLFRLK